MIYWQLFYVFFTIGLFTFGGGYAMIPLIKSEVVSRGWLTEEGVIQFIAVSESTPGPFAINIATFIGTEQGGFLGALVATLGVVLPSFIVILLVAALFTAMAKNRFVQAAMNGIRPVVVGLIGATGALLVLGLVWNSFPSTQSGTFNRSGLVLLIDLATLFFGYKLMRKKSLHPIALIVISAVLGILVYGL